MKTIEQVREFIKNKIEDYNNNIPEQTSQTYRDGMLEIELDILDFIDGDSNEND
jgi:hypothetical protein